MPEALVKYRAQVAVFLLGLMLTGGGVLLSKIPSLSSSEVEIIEPGESEREGGEVVVEVSGAVVSPGVYTLGPGSRVEDALSAAGGFSEEVDTEIVARAINRAAQVADGQKIYIPRQGERAVGQESGSNLGLQTSALVNVNTATRGQLEALWGIGPVTAQNIIEQRPYSTVKELLEKKILKSNVYERNKDTLTVF